MCEAARPTRWSRKGKERPGAGPASQRDVLGLGRKPGASAPAQPPFPWKEGQTARLSKRKAPVSMKGAEMPEKKAAPALPRNALPGLCLAAIPSADPAALPDPSPPPRVATQQRVPVPSRSHTALSPLPSPRDAGKEGERRGGRPSLSTAPPARPRRPPLPRVARCPAAGAGDRAGGGGDRGRTAQGRGWSRPLCIRRGRGAGGRANGRPPGATPRGAIRPPRSGPGPARRALHFLGAF